MNTPAWNSLGSEFDRFLFAPIGDDRNGLPLSTITLLGRMDLDPWQEAASLASLPADAATRRLSSLLSALPASALTQENTARVAVRLIALLPCRTDAEARSLGMVPPGEIVHPFAAMYAVLFAIWLIWLLGMQVVAAGRDAPTRAETAHAPTSVITSAQTPPTPSGK